MAPATLSHTLAQAKSSLITVEQALQQLQRDVTAICDTETIELDQALGRILAEPIISMVDVPPADNSSMDGYAVRASEIHLGQDYRISQRITAGTSPQPLATGTVARIFTGAEIPADADAIIIQEDATAADDKVSFSSVPEASANIRRRGQDLTQASEILSSGTKLRPQEVGLIASAGIKQVSVYKKLRVAILSTGDELVEPGETAAAGKIYNSNRYLLQSLCLAAGFEPVDMGKVADDFDTTVEALQHAAEKADVILTTGGVSVGEEDHIKPAIEHLGRLDLWKVAIKPGKPLALGKINGTDLIGLPGNPSSVFTTFLILALPRLRLLQGLNPQAIFAETLSAQFSHKQVSRQEYLRARKTEDGVEVFPNQSSGMLSSACWGDGFVEQPIDSQIVTGQPVKFISYTSLLNS